MAKTKTDLYKEHLQAIVKQETGQKVSKETAWNLFKAVIHGTVQFTTKQEDNALALAGVGKFEVLMTKPRGSKAGLDKEGNPIEGANVWEIVPRYRFYPSVAINRVVEAAYGLNEEPVAMIDYGIFRSEDAVKDTSVKEKKVKETPEPSVPQVPQAPDAPDALEMEDAFDSEDDLILEDF